MQLRPVRAKLFHAEREASGRTDRQTDKGRETGGRTDGRTDVQTYLTN